MSLAQITTTDDGMTDEETDATDGTRRGNAGKIDMHQIIKMNKLKHCDNLKFEEQKY